MGTRRKVLERWKAKMNIPRIELGILFFKKIAHMLKVLMQPKILREKWKMEP
jgi:hypothetical protein